MNDIYFEWLCDLVHGDDPDCSFVILLGTLHSYEFEWFLPLDEDRAINGIELRRTFLSSMPSDYINDDEIDIFMMRPCSVLEMLIALAIDIQEELMWNPDKGNRTVSWFWLMITNLNLNDLDDRHYISEKADAKVDDILTRWMHRDFDPDGTGSIFPIEGCNEDLRSELIWYQANQYFLQNFGVEEDMEIL